MSILITGSTGFLGNGILHLLNKNKYINPIYLLIRNKYNILAEERFNNIKKDFSNLNLNLIEHSILEISSIKLNIDIIINCAASIDFNLELNDALIQNVDGLLELIKFSKINNIKKFIHVSTAYVSSPGKIIKEKFINLKILGNIKKLYNNIKNKNINFEQIITKHYFPNTYCFTKCLAEKLIQHHIKTNPHSNITFSIIRPSIITPAINCPTPGWFKGYNAGIGFHKLIHSNIVNYLICNKHTQLNYVPVDYVSSIIIDSFLDNINIIKHATNCFETYSIDQHSKLYNKKIILINNTNYYTHILKYYSLIKIIFYIIYFYLLSFFNSTYNKNVINSKKLYKTVNNIQEDFSYFLKNTYIFDYSNVKTKIPSSFTSSKDYYISMNISIGK